MLGKEVTAEVDGPWQVWTGKEVRMRLETWVGEEGGLGGWDGHLVVNWGKRARSKVAGAEAKASSRCLASVVSDWRR